MMVRYIKEFYSFLKHIFENKELLLTLIVNDFKKQYLGSYLGLFWAFVQPTVYIAVIWVVFSYGLRAGSLPNGTPFILWLVAGMIPWFFFSEIFDGTTNAVIENDFLVKKVSFRVSILPLVPIGSSLIIHGVLVVVLALLFMFKGYEPNLYWLQLFYYLFCSIFIILGIGWITSAVRVFVKDISSIISVIVQIGFWATPVFWQIDLVPENYRWIVHLNPAEYIVTGYRDSLVNNVWFWEKPYETFYFLGLSSILFIMGAIVFRRLRPHFGDVL